MEKKDPKRDERKEMISQLLSNELYIPMKKKELAAFLQVTKEDRNEFDLVLQEMESDGLLQFTKKGKIIKAESKLLTGTFISNAKGFGFVMVEGEEEDFFISEENVKDAFHKDLVTIELLSPANGKRREAKIVSVVQHEITQVVGYYHKSANFGFVVPDNQKICSDIFVPKERSKGAVDGHKVVVQITDFGKGKKNPEGIITEILGHVNDPGVDILSIVKGYDLPTEFNAKVLKQVERVAKDVTEADFAGRRDLRDCVMVTIDGEDAKDLDDAVSLMIEDDVYHLGVHIADVTNYVQENSALDQEALKRGTSVYLVDRVIPMLPHALSNGICSLNAGVDRLAVSCLMEINKQGEVTNYELVESVIRVNRRMSYTSVKKILEDKDEAEITEYKELVPMFLQMEELAGVLRKKRRKRGSIDFDFPECKIKLDEMGKPIEIMPYERNVATNLIEDFMLLANETVAQHFFWQELPFIYRTHESPDVEKIKQLAAFIYNFGYFMKGLGSKGKISGEEVHPKEIQKLLEKIAGTEQEAMISRLALRSMKQAKYTTENTGHFGLACEYYCHFTSPIRRYPDLQIHRIIKEQYRGKLGESRIDHYREILPEVAKQCSVRERVAEEAERETNKLKKVEYMEQKIGEIYEGVISGISKWGIYVELPNTIEGMIHVSKIPGDFFNFREDTFEMVGETTKKAYHLGQSVKICVKGTDRFLRTIDFGLIEEDE